MTLSTAQFGPDGYQHFQRDGTEGDPTDWNSSSTRVHKFGAFDREGNGAYLMYRHTPSRHEPIRDWDMPHYRTGEDMVMFKTMVKGKHTVDMLFATGGHEHLVPGLLGRAAIHAEKTYGRRLQADGDLSEHSARLVQRLVDRGEVDAPKQGGARQGVVEATNMITKGSQDEMIQQSSRHPGTPVDRSEVDAGERHARNALRRPKADDVHEGMFPAEPYRGERRYARVPGWPERPEGH